MLVGFAASSSREKRDCSRCARRHEPYTNPLALIKTSSMKMRLLLLLLSSLFTNAYSQNKDCRCETDLTFLDSKIRKTPAYRINKKAYNASYSRILKEIASVNSIFDCHYLLNELLISLNDNHSKGIIVSIQEPQMKLRQILKSSVSLKIQSYLIPIPNQILI